MQMTRWLPAVALCAVVSTATARAAVTEDSFLVRNTGDLVDLCTAAQSDPFYTAASNFCQGFAAGVYRVLELEVKAQRTGRLFCPPDKPMTRNEGIASFVQWAKANPDQMSLQAPDGIARFLSQTFPCPRGR
jgi:hypothetical protein